MFKGIVSIMEKNGWQVVKEFNGYIQFQYGRITVIIPRLDEYTNTELDTYEKKTGLSFR